VRSLFEQAIASRATAGARSAQRAACQARRVKNANAAAGGCTLATAGGARGEPTRAPGKNLAARESRTRLLGARDSRRLSRKKSKRFAAKRFSELSTKSVDKRVQSLPPAWLSGASGSIFSGLTKFCAVLFVFLDQ
jgi:hypothetical protein